MAEIKPVPERIAERKTIVYKTLVDPTVVKITGEKMKNALFVRFGFLRPKPEEVQCVCMHACFHKNVYFGPHCNALDSSPTTDMPKKGVFWGKEYPLGVRWR